MWCPYACQISSQIPARFPAAFEDLRGQYHLTLAQNQLWTLPVWGVCPGLIRPREPAFRRSSWPNCGVAENGAPHVLRGLRPGQPLHCRLAAMWIPGVPLSWARSSSVPRLLSRPAALLSPLGAGLTGAQHQRGPDQRTL